MAVCSPSPPTWDVVFLEDGKVLLSDPFNIFQGDVVDLAADAFYRVLGCSRDMGPTLPPKVLQAVLKKSPHQDTDGKRASDGGAGRWTSCGATESQMSQFGKWFYRLLAMLLGQFPWLLSILLLSR